MNKEKAIILNAYKTVLNNECFKENKLHVITAAGIFCGNVNSDDKNVSQLIFEGINKSLSSASDEVGIKNLTKSFLTLYDVELLQNGCKVSMQSVNIFIDDIIGLSIGKM